MMPSTTAGTDHAAPTRRTPVRAPFAAVPHDVAADPRLTPTDLRVLAALLYFARQDPTCYPSDASLADRVHRHQGTVRRCLKRLEVIGYIRREYVPATPANPTGRVVHLRFTAPDWARPAPTPERQCAPTTERRRTPTPEHRRTPTPERQCAPTPCADARPPRAPTHADVRIEDEAEQRNVDVTDSNHPDAQTPMPLVAPAAPPLVAPAQFTPEPLVARTPVLPAAPAAPPLVAPAAPPLVAPVAPPLLAELQAVGPATSPEQVRRLAARLAQALHDPGSLGCYIAVLARVVAGTLALPCLMAAYRAGVGAVDKARKPGALFMWTLNNWVPPPLPSQIRPYNQQRTVTATTPPTSGPSPADRAREIHELQTMAADPRHPFRRVAAGRLAELGIDLGQIGAGG